MRRDLQRLAEEAYDLLIVGGGVNGLATAWDATLRGLKVALVEKGDYGAKTSSATLKIVHGGLRYLQHLDVVRARESIRERSAMLAIAPHLVSPFPFLVPTYGHFSKGIEFLTAGIVVNEIVSFDRNRRLQDPARRIPAGRVLSKRQCLDLMPCVDRRGLNGGVVFYDAQMHDSERLTLSFALSADAKGADLANYVEAVRLLKDGSRVTGARVRDALTGADFDVRAAVTANMSGPWSDIVLKLIDEPSPRRRVLRSKGIQIVTRNLTGHCGLAVQSHYEDPAAVFSRGTRHYFTAPWRGFSMFGTTDTVYEGDPDEFRITDADIRAFVDELNEALPSARLAREDVLFAVGGMRPVTETNLETGSQVARKYEVMDNASDLKVGGLITVIGVKYTTCRFLAEKVVDLVFEKLDRPSPPVATAGTPLAGGNIDRFDGFVSETLRHPPVPLGEETLRHLARSHGTGLHGITDMIRADASLADLIPGSREVTKAEVLHALRKECPVHLDDVVLRRTDLGTAGHPGKAALEAVADLTAAERGWDAARRAREIEACESRYVFRE